MLQVLLHRKALKPSKNSASAADVSLVDLQLPNMEATELLPVKEETSPKTVKITLSGSNQHGVASSDAFLGKPINPEKLQSIIESKLRECNLETQSPAKLKRRSDKQVND
jgi:DNA-binding NtrC family response regulator